MEILAYIIYLLLAAFLVLIVGYWFYHFGEVYIIEFFPQNQSFAKQLNKLLLIGYYLLNLGLMLNTFQSNAAITNFLDLLNFVLKHMADSFLIIAIMHYNNLFWIYFLSHNQSFKTKYFQS